VTAAQPGPGRAADRGTEGQAGGDFAWLTGFECSTFPQVGMDELALTQHDRFWGSDILRALDAGCRTIRYGIRWHVVNPQPNVWDWTSVDGPMELMRHLGMEPIVDLFHFGVPTWMGPGVMTSIFPDFQAELCRAFARRYPWIRWYTPTNEPYIMAQFGGENGAWFPYEHGPHNFVRALRNVAMGLCEGWRAIREERPDARMMISDTCEFWHADPADAPARERAARMNERRFVMHELYGGRLTADHPLRPWLVEHGFGEADLDWFLANPAPLDVIGLDHYPHSEHQLRSGPDGRLIDETRPLDQQHGPAELARQYFERLGRPLIFAETGAPGEDAAKIAWLDRLVVQARAARAAGVPLIGITWWGLIDQVDWGSGLRRFRHEIDPTGLYRLEWRDARHRPAEPPDPPQADGRGYRLERVPTGALESWRRYAMASPETTVGPLARSPTNAGIPLW
jgi:beta-glucosidase/6-phospho-beta-glucosidase/beta-galactosidase